MSPTQWWALAEAYSWVTIAYVGLRLVSFARLKRTMLGGLPSDGRPFDAQRLARLADAVDMAARNHPLSITCLPRSLALCRMTRTAGFAADIRFGVSKPGYDVFTAHAWVEVDGLVVGDRIDIAQDFARLEGQAELAGDQR